MNKGKFIALEGIDGSGKSTQAKLLATRLQAAGHRVHLTAEPTKGPMGKLIRSVFCGEMVVPPQAVAGLFVADRLEHLLDTSEGILHQLEQGITVISDRYYLSSYAYQGVQTSLPWVVQANRVCAQLCRPHLHVFIDISPADSMNRIQARGQSVELYENQAMLKSVRDMYFQAFELLKNEERIVSVSGNGSPESVANAVWAETAGLF